MSDSLTDFSALKILHLQGCGIGQMISEQASTQQIDELLSRPGFSYTAYDGSCRYGRIYEVDQACDLHDCDCDSGM
jgi:hypothetical protein